MKLRLLFSAVLCAAVPAFASDEDKVKAGDLIGTVNVKGINSAGAFVGDDAANVFNTYEARGKVKVSAKGGQVNKVETYLDWSAPGGVHGHVWEKLWISGDTYTGWSERQIQASNTNVFSREVIDGSVKQRIHSDGSGVVEWTVGDVTASSEDGSDATDDATVDPTPTPKPLPSVEVEEEGSFEGSFFRQIKIKARSGNRASIDFSESGYQRATVGRGNQLRTVQSDVQLEGTGKGSLDYHPTPEPTPTPSPSPSPTPEPTASPTATPDEDLSF